MNGSKKIFFERQEKGKQKRRKNNTEMKEFNERFTKSKRAGISSNPLYLLTH